MITLSVQLCVQDSGMFASTKTCKFMCLKVKVFVIKCDGQLFDAHIGVRYGGEHVEQIDLAATLAILFAVPIPVSSLGVLMSEALVGLSDGDRLKAAYINAMQILRVAESGLAHHTHS